MSGEWLEELELSSDVVHLDSPSISIQCTINGTPLIPFIIQLWESI
jgi:hypothetical protein